MIRPGMLVLSHRGHHPGLPENTMDSFAKALTLGVDGFETDIRRTLDEELVLFHDRNIPEGREVCHLTHADLCAAVGYPVPTLLEALQQWPDLFWNLEIQAHAALEKTLSLLGQHRFSGRIMITSFWHNVIAECLEQSDFDCGLLVAHRPFSLKSLVGDFTAQNKFRAVVWAYETLDEKILKETAGCGLQAFVYGAQTPAEHARLLAAPVDGIITDHPQLVRR